MQIKFGLISCDSHAQEHPQAWTSRMSKSKWGDRIPRVVETTDPAASVAPFQGSIERWYIDGQFTETRGTVNCPTAMGDPLRKTYPQRWKKSPPSSTTPPNASTPRTRTASTQKSSSPTSAASPANSSSSTTATSN